MKALKMLLSSFLVGALSIGLVWAGSVVSPVPDSSGASVKAPAKQKRIQEPVEETIVMDESSAADFQLQGGQVLAGASKTSIAPRPDDYGGVWETDPATCKTAGYLEHLGPTRATIWRRPDRRGRRTPTASTWAASASAHP